MGAFCTYCLGSLALMTTVLVLASVASSSRAKSWRTWGRGGLVAAGAVAVLTMSTCANSSLIDPRGGSEGPRLAGLADHLKETGAVFYGAYWCPACQQQKDEFGAAEGRLPYVECSPNGPRQPQSVACNRADVSRYPTWIIGGRRFEGVMPPEDLARFSNYVGTTGQ